MNKAKVHKEIHELSSITAHREVHDKMNENEGGKLYEKSAKFDRKITGWIKNNKNERSKLYLKKNFENNSRTF